ncbi:MAG TPA: tetratricopeptide repeat protein [Candidatus Limnocylindrales bacterium]
MKRPVLEAAWDFAISHLTAEEIFDVGVTAYFRGESRQAERLFAAVALPGRTSYVVGPAILNLGILLTEQGRPAEAEEAYRQAIASGHADQAPRAAVNLGVLLSEQGRPAEAEESYRQAIASGHADQAPRAADNLGALLKERGRLEANQSE